MKKDKNTFVQTRWSNRKSSRRAPSVKLNQNQHARSEIHQSVQSEREDDSFRPDQKRIYTPKKSKESGASIVIPPAPVYSNHSYDTTFEMEVEESSHGSGRKDDSVYHSAKNESLFKEILSMLENPSSDRSIYHQGLNHLKPKGESSSSYFEGDIESNDYLEESLSNHEESSDEFGFLADIASSFESTSSVKYDGIKDFYSIQGKWKDEDKEIRMKEEEEDDMSTIFEEISTIIEESSSSPDVFASFHEGSSSSVDESSEYYEETSSDLDDSTFYDEESLSSVESSVEYEEELLTNLEKTMAPFQEPSSNSSDHQSQNFPEILEEIMCSSESSDHASCQIDDDCMEEYSCEESDEEKGTPVIKLPVLLSRVNVDVDVLESLKLDGDCEVSKIACDLLSVQVKTMAPSSKVFFSGIFQVCIEYVNNHEKGSLHTIKYPIYWDKVENIDWLSVPDFPKSHQNEYTFKDSSSVHHELYQEYTHQIQSHVKSSNFVWHGSAEEENKNILLQGIARLSIDLLQEQYVKTLIE